MFTFLDLKEPVTGIGAVEFCEVNCGPLAESLRSMSRSSADCGAAYSSMRDEGYCCEEAVDWTTALARLAEEWRTRASSGDECWNLKALGGVCSAENVAAMADIQQLQGQQVFQ